MYNFLLDVKDAILYDLLKRPLPPMPKISFEDDFVHLKEDHGFVIESRKYPGLIASGETEAELREALFDTMLTYFDVPRATAKRLPDTLVLKLPNGKTINPPSPNFTIRVAAA